ncbi:MAG: LysM peptidoglycan-binding domain-containing protein [Gammaproteobacteria bacterium]|nr:LysM peptidoglycan-binding domain-containing protein [Gammaproteobacteria bacterium]
MSRSTLRFSLLVVPALLLGLAACTPFESLWRKLPRPAAKPATVTAAPRPELPLATATHRFNVAPDQDVVGHLQVTIARHEDTLTDIARRFNIGYEEIIRANPGVDPWLPGEGTPVVLPTEFVLPDAPREGLVLNLAAMRLYYFPKREKDAPIEVITHPIGIGRVGWVTPEGSTKVVARVKDPVWVPPVSVRQEHAKDGDILPEKVPPGPDNPLGRHMFRLGWPSYLVHGTNKPPGVGMRSSHGCIRLYPEDIEALYDSMPIGTRVTVVNQPYLLGWRGGQLLTQAYAPHEDDRRDWSDVPKALRKNAVKPRATLWKRVAAQVDSIDWESISQAAANPRGIALPVGPGAVPDLEALLAQAPRVRNALPQGASWDGVEDQYAGEPEFKKPAVTGAADAATASR